MMQKWTPGDDTRRMADTIFSKLEEMSRDDTDGGKRFADAAFMAACRLVVRVRGEAALVEDLRLRADMGERELLHAQRSANGDWKPGQGAPGHGG